MFSVKLKYFSEWTYPCNYRQYHHLEQSQHLETTFVSPQSLHSQRWPLIYHQRYLLFLKYIKMKSCKWYSFVFCLPSVSIVRFMALHIAGSVLLHCCEVFHCMNMPECIRSTAAELLGCSCSCLSHVMLLPAFLYLCFGAYMNVFTLDIYPGEELLGQENRNHTGF